MSYNTTKAGYESRILKVRSVFCIICSLMFATNIKFSFPLHTLIAYILKHVEAHLDLCNSAQLGVCVSADTHARYVQYRYIDTDYNSDTNSVPNVVQ